MLAVLTLELEARDLTANRLRRWQVDISYDLFGAWIADVQYGRIGSRGRQARLVFESQPDVDAFLRQRLHRRASAKRRIGVDYRYVHASDEVRNILGQFGIRSARPSDDERPPQRPGHH
jgi:predicted DNA-binding WGR domain protein